MIKIENTEVLGWGAAIRGMRNPMNSWDKSDSCRCHVLNELSHKNESYRCAGCKNEFVSRPNCFVIGPNDYDLMLKLRNAGTDHCKFMRMIVVYVDIMAPLYWWKEFDTYKVGTVANSCSTMHKITEKKFERDDFSHEHLSCIDIGGGVGSPYWHLQQTIVMLNECLNLYLKTEDKKYWWQMIQLLPSSYNQKRTVMLNYEVLANIYKSRQNHKLDEWHTLCDWIKGLPYSELITGKEKSNG